MAGPHHPHNHQPGAGQHPRKEGPVYDLPIALGILASTGQLTAPRLGDYLIAGELSLSGKTRPIKGALPLALLAKEEKKTGVILPPVSAEEAALMEAQPIYKVNSLDEAVLFLSGKKMLPRVKPALFASPAEQGGAIAYDRDFSEVRGQQNVRRAVEIAVTGGHNLLMIGPPGSGKSMISKRIPTIFPDPTMEEFLEILSIHSASGNTLNDKLKPFERPFRSPHHTISDVGLLGGGAIPGPGEISLAHHGVLFLDELPEFKRSALEVLRQPLEDGNVTISRSAGKITLPCSFMLVAAMNPCPCGYLGDQRRECRCTPPQIQRYRARISGPLLDRIDIHVEAPSLSIGELRKDTPAEASEPMRDRIAEARCIQQKRFHGSRIHCNGRMSQSQLKKNCQISFTSGDLLQQAMEQLHLSARAYDRILKVSRTIADLADCENIDTPHLLEAIQYRSLDRNIFY